MPEVLRIAGHRFFFFSKEGTEPPHIHVETAEKTAKFWLEPVELAYSYGYNSREQRRIRDIVIEYREYFLERWNAHFQKGGAGTTDSHSS